MLSQVAAAIVPFAARSLAERMALVVHISAGGVGIISGFTALFATKGSPLHRRIGKVFFYSMLAMGLMGAAIAVVWSRFAFINVPAGLLTAYLVVTGFATVQPEGSRLSALGSGRAALGLMLVPIGLGLVDVTMGFQAVTSPKGTLFGFPPAPFFIFATLALIATVGDWQTMRAGGVQALRGAPRLARHLWRMNAGLLIAAFSFFLGQAKVIPKPIRILPLLIIPPLVVLVALFYWLWRVRFRRSLRGLVVSAASAPQTVQGMPPSPATAT